MASFGWAFNEWTSNRPWISQAVLFLFLFFFFPSTERLEMRYFWGSGRRGYLFFHVAAMGGHSCLGWWYLWIFGSQRAPFLEHTHNDGYGALILVIFRTVLCAWFLLCIEFWVLIFIFGGAIRPALRGSSRYFWPSRTLWTRKETRIWFFNLPSFPETWLWTQAFWMKKARCFKINRTPSPTILQSLAQ